MGIFLLAYLIYYNSKVSDIKRKEWTRYIENYHRIWIPLQNMLF